MGIECVTDADRRVGLDARLAHVTMPRALDAGRVRELKAGAALHQRVNYLGDRSLVTAVETVPLCAKLVRDPDVGGRGWYGGVQV